MEKEFVPYNLALELKELGFAETCFGSIDQIGYIHVKGSKSSPRGSMMYNIIDCPTFSQAFRFFREKYGLYGEVTIITIPKIFRYYIYSEDDILEGHKVTSHNEAEITCIKKLIEIAKKQNIK